MEDHMTMNGRSHDNEWKITWQWLEDHMTMTGRSYDNEWNITWQWLEDHMTMTEASGKLQNQTLKIKLWSFAI